MSVTLDKAVAATGTGFRIFVLPRYAEATFARNPEIVTVSVTPNAIMPRPTG